ncbi:hypothetical protein [Yersinia enterocolitica]|uniref:Uncharacterized protein n=1 Tax=Yersinia enterocolitica TaxID=630 RepID=A0ABM9SIL7_YEREN|nr:hypothetical protein [Yersinia enterocolitica]CNE70484.1 Uncharacterised protein [Yersinia enterocolitica]CNG54855.1 Uncharacterised protein [Yersinia enterocolitica]CQD73507.1 Uncharacterised protein [Yersinia enterocolitica]CRX97047.1 Uncharacterised protein [Yersinia enterocolitica]
MARTKGAVRKATDNRFTKEYISSFWEYEELPNWIDDCICGALGQAGKDTRLSPIRFFRALQTLDEIDTLIVGSYFNKKKEFFDDKPLSKRTIECYTKILRTASDAIAHHRLNPNNSKFGGSRGSRLEQQAITPPEIAMQQSVSSSVKASDDEMHKLHILSIKWSAPDLSEVYTKTHGSLTYPMQEPAKVNPLIGVVFTEEEKEHIRNLALTGKTKEIKTYTDKLKREYLEESIAA